MREKAMNAMPKRQAVSLGQFVRTRRWELGISQEQLAERISGDDDYVRQSEISRLETGRVSLPRRDRLERLAAALGVSLGDLLVRSGWNGAERAFELHEPEAQDGRLEQPTSMSPPAWLVEDAEDESEAERHAARARQRSLAERNRQLFDANRRAFEQSQRQFEQQVARFSGRGPVTECLVSEDD
jgi:transcriptional regulator with XRE-family HTH domain